MQHWLGDPFCFLSAANFRRKSCHCLRTEHRRPEDIFLSIKHVFRAIFSGNYLGCVLQRVALVRTANRLIFMRLDKSRILPTRVHRTACSIHFQTVAQSCLTLFSLCFVFTLPIELVLLGHSLQLLRTGGENWSILENVPEMTLAIINKKKTYKQKWPWL